MSLWSMPGQTLHTARCVRADIFTRALSVRDVQARWPLAASHNRFVCLASFWRAAALQYMLQGKGRQRAGPSCLALQGRSAPAVQQVGTCVKGAGAQLARQHHEQTNQATHCWQAGTWLRPGGARAQYNNQLLQLFTSSLFIAGLLAGLVATVPTRHLGRRATMLVSYLKPPENLKACQHIASAASS